MVQIGDNTEHEICDMLVRRRKGGEFSQSDIDMLLRLSEDSSKPKVATIAVQIIQDIGPNAKVALPRLLKLFEEYVNHHYGKSLAKAIAAIGESTPDTMTACLRGQRSNLKSVRVVSRDAMRKLKR